MSTVEILRAARARIDTPEKFWQSRRPRHPGDTCALLALADLTESNTEHPAMYAVARAMGLPAAFAIPGFNDSHTHAEVMAAFDRAIEVELAREQEFAVEPTVTEPVAA